MEPVVFEFTATWDELNTVRAVMKDATQSPRYTKHTRESVMRMLRELDSTLGYTP